MLKTDYQWNEEVFCSSMGSRARWGQEVEEKYLRMVEGYMGNILLSV
jgi:hypothetical protein